MGDRLNAYLEGELPFDALDANEQAEALALESAIRTAAGRFAGVRAPELTARVMASLPVEPSRGRVSTRAAGRAAGWWAKLADWFRLPAGGLAPRPALALAAVAMVVGFVLGALLPAAPPAGPAGAADASAAPAAPAIFVRFELEAEGAREVRLAGSFTGWEPRHELTPLSDGRWSVTLPMEPGVHDYVFVVDGESFVEDPWAARVSDGFGGFNSRLALLAPGS
jgi:hypothetical protein